MKNVLVRVVIAEVAPTKESCYARHYFAEYKHSLGLSPHKHQRSGRHRNMCTASVTLRVCDSHNGCSTPHVPACRQTSPYRASQAHSQPINCDPFHPPLAISCSLFSSAVPPCHSHLRRARPVPPVIKTSPHYAVLRTKDVFVAIAVARYSDLSFPRRDVGTLQGKGRLSGKCVTGSGAQGFQRLGAEVV